MGSQEPATGALESVQRTKGHRGALPGVSAEQLDEAAEQAGLQAWVTVENRTGASYRDANLLLVEDAVAQPVVIPQALAVIAASLTFALLFTALLALLALTACLSSSPGIQPRFFMPVNEVGSRTMLLGPPGG